MNLTTVLRFALICYLALASHGLAASRRPNVVVILSDDQGWGDLSFNGNTNISTPNIDGLARAGVSLRPILRVRGFARPPAPSSSPDGTTRAPACAGYRRGRKR
jgi:hypothetical protein